MVYYDFKTKPCPFCAETIQAQAIKCRFCGEYLNTPKAKAIQADCEAESQEEQAEQIDDGVLFACRPSLWGILPTFIQVFAVLVVGGLIIKYPIESILNQNFDMKLSTQLIATISQYRILAGVILIGLTLIALSIKVVNLKMIHYEVSLDRIEWSRGLVDRKVDNIDMFRITDLKLRRNLLDCVLGIGKVVLITSDKTDPEFVFKKIRESRTLYDIIKKASLDADRKTNVVHVE
jgi:hypothetical protein